MRLLPGLAGIQISVDVEQERDFHRGKPQSALCRKGQVRDDPKTGVVKGSAPPSSRVCSIHEYQDVKSQKVSIV